MKTDLTMSEADLKEIVISVAKRYGWLIHHDLPAQNSRGRWLTNVQGDAGMFVGRGVPVAHEVAQQRPTLGLAAPIERYARHGLNTLVIAHAVNQPDVASVEDQRAGVAL